MVVDDDAVLDIDFFADYDRFYRTVGAALIGPDHSQRGDKYILSDLYVANDLGGRIDERRRVDLLIFF